MSVCLMTIRDGRDEIHEHSLASARHMLPNFDHVVEVDDSEHTLGFAGAIQEGWERVLETGADYVFHFEADFIFKTTVPIERMISVLERRPYIAQMTLKRQAVNEEEKRAGGIVELHPDDFLEVNDDWPDCWTEHRRYFSTNPSVYSTRLCALGWPQEEHSEGVFTHRLLKDPLLRFAIWGWKFDPPRVEHIGERVGWGY
jgi:hypothetical protein